jgi:hypothetical protein
MKTSTSLKVGDVVNVIFSVGYEHPLFNKPVKGKITMIGGYNGKCIEAETLELVHYNDNPHGLLCYDKYGNFIGYETKPAYDEIWTGWIEKIVY